MTPAEPELYVALLRSHLDAQHQQQLAATSNAKSISLRTSENTDLSNVAGRYVTAGAGEQMDWSTSTPFAVPPPSDALSQSSDSPRAGMPFQPHSGNASGSFSLSSTKTNAGSVGAMRRSHTHVGHAHPYAADRRLDALTRNQKQLTKKRGEMERDEVES